MNEAKVPDEKTSSSIDDNWDTSLEGLSEEIELVELNEFMDVTTWTQSLGVVSKPNALDDWDQLYNLNNQCALRNDCRKLAVILKNKKSVPELESFLTLYCKKRDCDYSKNTGWLPILEKILLLNLPSTQEFNVFYAFTTKYIPLNINQESKLYDFFHLLLQYHDPQLSIFMESLHLSPYTYSRNWFGTLFASSMSTESCHELWKQYIQHGDPFLVFHLIIVVLINAKDQILKLKKDDKSKVLEVLEKMSTQLTIEDIPDFFQLAMHYSDNTPDCFRKDFHHAFFGNEVENEVETIQLSKMMCMPVSAIDLTFNDEVSSGKVNFFVIDTRSNIDFDSGHFISSFNLDCVSIVDNPEKFEIALSSLENYKKSKRLDDHYLVIGYGNESKDKYMNMLIAMFIQRSKSFVSVVQGGYEKLHDCVNKLARWELIAMHNLKRCPFCKKEKLSQNWGLFTKMKSVMNTTTNKIQEHVESAVSATNETSNEDKPNHVNSNQRHEKRYRQQSVFTIDEPSDEEISTEAAVDENPKEEILLSKEFIETFECKELFHDSSIHGYIALTRTHMYVLHNVASKKGYVTTEARHALSTIVAVSSRKKVPEVLTFKLGYEMNGKSTITAIHKLYVPKAGECAKAVKLAIYALRPLLDI